LLKIFLSIFITFSAFKTRVRSWARDLCAAPPGRQPWTSHTSLPTRAVDAAAGPFQGSEPSTGVCPSFPLAAGPLPSPGLCRRRRCQRTPGSGSKASLGAGGSERLSLGVPLAASLWKNEKCFPWAGESCRRLPCQHHCFCHKRARICDLHKCVCRRAGVWSHTGSQI